MTGKRSRGQPRQRQYWREEWQGREAEASHDKDSTGGKSGREEKQRPATTKTVLEGRVAGKRSRGQPRQRQYWREEWQGREAIHDKDSEASHDKDSTGGKIGREEKQRPATTKTVLEGRVAGKRSRGQPRQRQYWREDWQGREAEASHDKDSTGGKIGREEKQRPTTTKTVLEGRVTGKRSRGQPRQRQYWREE